MFMTSFLVLISTARSSTNFPKPTKNSIEKHLPVIINDETNLEPEMSGENASIHFAVRSIERAACFRCYKYTFVITSFRQLLNCSLPFQLSIHSRPTADNREIASPQWHPRYLVSHLHARFTVFINYGSQMSAVSPCPLIVPRFTF